MTAKNIMATGAKAAQTGSAELLKQYGCGPIQFSGTDRLYERHLQFDYIIDEKEIGPREQFEAAARSVRDILSQRWVLTEKTYERENPKRVYYLSMEFLLAAPPGMVFRRGALHRSAPRPVQSRVRGADQFAGDCGRKLGLAGVGGHAERIHLRTTEGSDNSIKSST